MVNNTWRNQPGAWLARLIEPGVPMFADLRDAVRLLARTRGFTTAVVVILALGIGANTAAFTIVRAVLLRPLPYHEPDRLVYLWNGLQTNPGNRHGILTGSHIADYTTRNTTLGSYAVLKSWETGLDGQIDFVRGGTAERLRGVSRHRTSSISSACTQRWAEHSSRPTATVSRSRS